jgi:hypothetical protein
MRVNERESLGYHGMSAFSVEWIHLLIQYSSDRVKGLARLRGLSLQYVKDAGGNLRHIYRPRRDDVAVFGRSQEFHLLLKPLEEFPGGQSLFLIMERGRPPP